MNIGPTAKVLLFEKSTLEYLQLVVVGPLQYVQKEVYIYIYGITLNLETVLCNTLTTLCIIVSVSELKLM